MRRLLGLAVAGLLSAAGPAQAAWRLLDFPKADVSLRAVALTGPTAFQVSGSKGTYAVTADAGRTWRQVVVPGGEALDFRGLAAPAPGTVILTSAGEGPAGQARIYRTGDGGAAWSLAFETRLPGAFLDGVAFWDRDHGLAFGDPIDGRWFLLRTSDGGRSWARIDPVQPPLLTGEAAFAASNSALFLGPKGQAWIVSGGAAQGRAFHSTDGGKSWRVAETPIAGGPTGGVFGGLALGGGRAVAVGGDHKDELRATPNIALADGGRWTLAAQAAPAGLLESVGRLDAHTLLAVGPRGTSLSRDGGKTWRQIDTEAFHAIACAKRTCVAAGPKGRVGLWMR
jgi:photosystem II stability/assembly factor-like uncharacterized protein